MANEDNFPFWVKTHTFRGAKISGIGQVNLFEGTHVMARGHSLANPFLAYAPVS